MKLVLGIDPGAERTGMAEFWVNEDEVSLAYQFEIKGGPQGFAEWATKVKLPLYDLIVVEDYEIHRTAGDPRGLEIIGMVRLEAVRHGIEFILQPAAGRKQSVSDTALKNLGMYEAGDANRNSREAIRHVIWYYKGEGHRNLLKKGWPQK